MTVSSTKRQLAQLRQQRASLDAAIADLERHAPTPWPKPFRFNLHASRETMRAIGLALGYTGEELKLFEFFGYDVEGMGLAEANGQARLVEVAGMRLVPREEE